jgi:hypothetical protein
MTVDREAGSASRPAEGGPAGQSAQNWRTVLSRESTPGPQDVSEWFRAKGVTVTAVTLMAIELVWMAALLAHSYFEQDDYHSLDWALTHGFTWSYLMRVESGHMLPLGYAIIWVMARVSLYNWPLAWLSILAFLVAACLALLRMLRTLFGNRPTILVPFLVYVFSPLALAAIAWGMLAFEVLPLELALFMAVDAHVRYLRSGRLRHVLAAAGWLLLGLAAMDKGALVPLVLFALTSAFFVEGRWAVAAIRALRRYWLAWVLYGGLAAGYSVIFAIQLRGSAVQPAAPGAASFTSLASTMVGSTLIPGALGGPWRWLPFGFAVANPPAALQQLSWAVAALIVLASCWYRTRAWRAWAILFGWVLAADILPIALGRLGLLPASLLGLESRYVTDATPMLALCVGLAFLPLEGEQGGYRFQLPVAAPAGPGAWASRAGPGVARAATGLVLAVFLAGSFWSLQALEAMTHTAAARSYIATARVAVARAPRGTLIVDGPTPATIMDPAFFFREGYTSQVIGPLARSEPGRHLSWALSPHGALRGVMIFDPQGRLRPAVLAGPSSVPRPHGQRCWSLTAAGASIPLPRPLFRWSWTVRLDYSGPAAVLALRFGEKWADARLPAGAHAFYVPLVGEGTQLTVRQLGPAPSLPGTTHSRAGTRPAQCLASVTVGTWQPAPSGQAVPMVPVSG